MSQTSSELPDAVPSAQVSKPFWHAAYMTNAAGRRPTHQHVRRFNSCKPLSMHVCKVHAAESECQACHITHLPLGHALIHDHAAAGRGHEHREGAVVEVALRHACRMSIHADSPLPAGQRTSWGHNGQTQRATLYSTVYKTYFALHATLTENHLTCLALSNCGLEHAH